MLRPRRRSIRNRRSIQLSFHSTPYVVFSRAAVLLQITCPLLIPQPTRPIPLHFQRHRDPFPPPCPRHGSRAGTPRERRTDPRGPCVRNEAAAVSRALLSSPSRAHSYRQGRKSFVIFLTVAKALGVSFLGSRKPPQSMDALCFQCFVLISHKWPRFLSSTQGQKCPPHSSKTAGDSFRFWNEETNWVFRCVRAVHPLNGV